MGLRLRTGVSFCVASDRMIFLDLDRDRYFCLANTMDAAFRHLIKGERISGEDRERIARLRRDGLLIETDDEAVPRPCGTPDPAKISCLDLPTDAVPLKETIAAFVHLGQAEARLRLRGLRKTFRWLEHAKRRAKPSPPQIEQELRTIASAFQNTALIATPLNKCLPRGIALASRCFSAGVTPTVVIAVKLQPFAAHCWVQHGDLLLNERLDRVREFVPIRVL